jgi:hypothetical protein
MMAFYVAFRNFCRDHKTPRMTPAHAMGQIKSAMPVSNIVTLIHTCAEPSKPRGPYNPRQPKTLTKNGDTYGVGVDWIIKIEMRAG